MITKVVRYAALAILSTTCSSQAAEQLYRAIPPDARPQLSQPGVYPVGVTTQKFVIPASLQIGANQRYDRPLTLELWYPAQAGSGQAATYQNQTRTGQPFTIAGQALRDAKTQTAARQYPLVVLSHGYTGYRTLMFYLAEHLASHGYVVAAIDHTDSTNQDIDFAKAPFAGFLSTLYNRARDQQATLDYLTSPKNPLQSLIDPKQAGLIGYSMGGFGALNTLGGCYQFPLPLLAQFSGLKDSAALEQLKTLLDSCHAGKPAADPRWQAGIVLAPWGGQLSLFTAASLQGLTSPLLYIAGDQDDISGYQGIRQLFTQTGSKASYLLTYHAARHNIAGHPAPAVASLREPDYSHYAEPAWDVQNLNHINQHFVLAMLNCHLKHQTTACQYLQPGAQRSDAANGWHGFPARYNTGMSWETNQPGSNRHSDSATANGRDN